MQDNPGRPAQKQCAADGCEKNLRSNNSTGYCRVHQSATSRVPVRICAAEDCDARLRVTNRSGYCNGHVADTPNVKARNEMLRTQRAEHREAWPECSFEGCTKRLRADNRTGRCRKHTDTAVRPKCPVKGCENRLIASNKVGRCQEHAGAHWVAPICGAVGCGRILYRDNQTGRCQKHRSDYNRDKNLQIKYGITAEQYDTLLAGQGGVCAVCGHPPNPEGVRAASRLHVDHDHATGRVRGLLCLNCNRGLGSFLDDPALLRRAADYIERHLAVAA